jgi:hypothetical protein
MQPQMQPQMNERNVAKQNAGVAAFAFNRTLYCERRVRPSTVQPRITAWRGPKVGLLQASEIPASAVNARVLNGNRYQMTSLPDPSGGAVSEQGDDGNVHVSFPRHLPISSSHVIDMS